MIDALKNKRLSDLNTLENVLSCTQNLHSSHAEQLKGPLLEKILFDTLNNLSDLHREDMTLYSRYVVAVLLNLLGKLDDLTNQEVLITMKVLLNLPSGEESQFKQRNRVWEELFAITGIWPLLGGLETLYNEVKFNLNVLGSNLV
jgi:hypothetical protein